jgi:hypothetical protein
MPTASDVWSGLYYRFYETGLQSLRDMPVPQAKSGDDQRE